MIDCIVLDKVNMKAPMQVESSMLWNTRVEFRKGEAYLIEAASGRGKSSLCSFLCGLRSDYTGKISFLNDGTELNLSSATDYVLLRQRAIAIMFQDLKLFPELSSLDNVMLKNQITGFCTEKEVCDMLGKLGLEEYLHTPCARMSLGQQQRVAFVRALCQPTDFILLDEPVSHLDNDNAVVMSQMLHERAQRDNVGLIVTSIGYRLPYEYDRILQL